MWRRIWILFNARNKEFFRDKASLGWNFLFPFLVIIGFSAIFSDDDQILYKVGVFHSNQEKTTSIKHQYNNLKQTKFIEFVEYKSKTEAQNKLKHHRLDFLIDIDTNKYWVSETSPKGYIVERLFHAKLTDPDSEFEKQSIQGREVPYVEWLLPGILGLNMMFSALFGVGFVVVRYRKNGVLKRLSVTPLKPYEFLTAQVISRMFVLLATTTIVFIGCVQIIGFKCQGSYLLLLLLFTLGGFCLVALGLIVASRSSSEEFAGGVLNLITWPMMFFSEVWFSLEGANPWVQKISKLLPLTHVIEGARKIMSDGAGLLEIQSQMIYLVVLSCLFIITGSVFFKWQN